MTAPQVISIVGPTASGKTSLSLQLAELLHGEIVNLDAFQIYREMDIGTAKPTQRELQAIRHHLIDIVDIDFEASVAQFQMWARAAITDITSRGKSAICVGGSGLYVRAVFDDLIFPSTNPLVRSRYEEMLESRGPDELHQLLTSRAPEVAAQIAPTNTRRVVRALEVIELTGTFNPQLPDSKPVIDAFKIGLMVEREVLANRIEQRVDDMVDRGWQTETANLVAKGLLETRTASKAIGYREIAAVNAGDLDLVNAKTQIAAITLKFSKRQMQWFKRDTDVHWFAYDQKDLVQKVLENF